MGGKRNDKKRRVRRGKGSSNHGGRGDEDDSDVDSRGNIKGLIDYDYESEDSDSSYEDSDITSVSSPIARRTRSSSIKKQKLKLSKMTFLKQKLERERERLKQRLQNIQLKKKRKSATMNEEVDESSSSDESIVVPGKKRLGAAARRGQGFIIKKKKSTAKESSESSMDDEEEYEDEDDETSEGSDYEGEEDEEENEESEDEEMTEEDEDEEDEDEMDDEEDDSHARRRGASAPGIVLSFGGLGGHDESDHLIPKRHNMKKEPEDVKKFVKLITKPSEENTIDTQIDQFKALPLEKQKKILDVLESRKGDSVVANPEENLMFRILTMNLPKETQSMVLGKYNSMQMLDPGSSEYFKTRNWLEKLSSLPLGIYKQIPVKIADGQEVCGAFMEKARRCLDDAIYGQDEAKLQVLQFIGTKIANPNSRGLSLLLTGPPGIGKTSLIKNGIAKALGWPFQFISLGGDSDASTYTGHQLVYESSHCGKIVNSLIAAKSMSMILMFDEVDKISTTPKGEEVQHLLVHMTDPVQNDDFEDKYLAGVPIDLSKAMFVFSANDLNRIDRVLLDRFTVVQLQGYSQKEKLEIAEHYLLPSALKDVDLAEKVGITKDALQYILDTYAKEETGVRELKRCLESISQKLNMLRMFNTKDLPFHIKDFTLPFMVKKEHIDLFLKKRVVKDDSAPYGMYT